MNQEQYSKFSEGVTWLHSLYPASQMHEGTPAAWWELLREYSWEAVRTGFRRANKEGQGQFCPSAEVVRRHADAAAKSIPKAYQANLKQLPKSPDGATASGFRLADDNPCERLARIWDAENAYYSDKGGVPKEKLKRRAGEIIQMLGKVDTGAAGTFAKSQGAA